MDSQVDKFTYLFIHYAHDGPLLGLVYEQPTGRAYRAATSSDAHVLVLCFAPGLPESLRATAARGGRVGRPGPRKSRREDPDDGTRRGSVAPKGASGRRQAGAPFATLQTGREESALPQLFPKRPRDILVGLHSSRIWGRQMEGAGEGEEPCLCQCIMREQLQLPLLPR